MVKKQNSLCEAGLADLCRVGGVWLFWGLAVLRPGEGLRGPFLLSRCHFRGAEPQRGRVDG